jgi:hypothetical protein
VDEFVAADTIQALFLDVVDRLRKHNENKGKTDSNSQHFVAHADAAKQIRSKRVARGRRALADGAAQCSPLSSLYVARCGLLQSHQCC